MARDHTFGGIWRALIHIKTAPDRHHHREQQKREADAEHRQDAAALVAKRVSDDKTGLGHKTPVIKRYFESSGSYLANVAKAIHYIDLRRVVGRNRRAQQTDHSGHNDRHDDSHR